MSEKELNIKVFTEDSDSWDMELRLDNISKILYKNVVLPENKSKSEDFKEELHESV